MTAEAALKWWSAFRAPRGAEVELYVENEQTREIARAEGRPKEVLQGRSSGAAVRVLRDGRQGFAGGPDLSPSGLRRLVERAGEAARRLPRDPARALPGPARAGRMPEPMDRAILSRSEAGIQRFLAGLERRVLKADRRVKSVLRLTVHETRGEHWIFNSQGVQVHEPHASVSFALEVLGEQGSDRETVWGSRQTRAWAALDAEAVARDAVRRLGAVLGGSPLRTGSWPVVFSPRVGVDFLELIGRAASADSVQRGRSWLADALGHRVGSRHVTVLDDGTLPGGVATGPWDAEGVPTGRTAVLAEGVVRSFLFDTETARRAGRSSTGNAVRPGREAPPSPGPTNLFLAGGPASGKRLLAETPRAFLVWDVIGMHTADPASGDFSVGASGVLWEDGRIRRGVRAVTLSGDLKRLLSGIDAVADDLAWQGALGCPTFRVRGLAVGGS